MGLSALPISTFSIFYYPFCFLIHLLSVLSENSLVRGWRTNGFTSVVVLLPYSIVTHFLDCGCQAGRLKIAPLASGGPRYTDWPWCPVLMPCLVLNISPVKKIRCIQFYGYLVLLMDNIQCICLFSPDVHLHMLASEKVGLVTWP
jgi:hypothetical protein